MKYNHAHKARTGRGTDRCAHEKLPEMTVEVIVTFERAKCYTLTYSIDFGDERELIVTLSSTVDTTVNNYIVQSQ
jgi:hypothetical protein